MATRTSLPLSLLLGANALAHCAGLVAPAQGLPQPAPAGGGTLTLGKEAYRFVLEAVNLAPAQPKLKLPRAFVLRGRLEAETGAPLSFELTALEDGRIYGLRIVRKRPAAGDDDRWGASLKTKVEVLELDARPGGKLRIAVTGPLTYAQGGEGGATTWKGELWGTFETVPL